MLKLFAMALLATVVAPMGLAQGPGVSESEILFGQTAAIEGPAAALGAGMRLGIAAAFDEANQAGGVDGRQLRLITLNDSYEPEAAIENIRQLIGVDNVFAVIGSVGTPTSRVSEPIATAAGVPFIGSFTGADELRHPFRRTVVNVRASYAEETEELVKRLTEDLGIRRIAVLYQDDSYGESGLSGVRDALRRRNLAVVSEGSYIRNTVAVKAALLNVRDAEPEAVIIIGAYQPSAVFTKWARKLGLNAVIANISFVGSAALAAELGPDGENVIISQVVPFPGNTTLPLVREYRRSLRSFEAEATPDFVSLEGYLVGRLTIAALKRAGPNLSREAFLDVFDSPEPFDIGGLTLTFGPSDNQGLDRVFLTRIDGRGKIVPIQHIGAR